MIPANLKSHYEEQGYVIIPALISPSEFSLLQEACARVVEKARQGEWMQRRTVGKQFPPFDNIKDVDVWGVQHLMHPDLGEPIFLKWYTGDRLVEVAKELLGCQETELQMELFNLLINPNRSNFALRWHRDDVRENASEEEERKALDIWHHGIQWNTALYRDACLYVVPGSHKVPRTPEQRKHSETMEPPKNPFDMPGMIQVVLQPGETVVYNSNIIHCATYDCRAPRATLHGCMGDMRGGSSRARNILQHGLEWMESEKFGRTMESIEDEKIRTRALMMWDSLLKMKQGVNGVDIGFSLSN
ncbi:hypothetical protein AMATHDRAFT_149734 [Amanita thiersii Skay4041]|uniref:Phytanoyl-CoA dioxygenase n=1 Tax=Amanita thiersii Skay4041 TaxID=703135 RepID=A0A2A9NLA5_9AGAR|nr:hypothetical protein AMATHDRAFT_149734 [Amanita thiersii Skay4041]